MASLQLIPFQQAQAPPILQLPQKQIPLPLMRQLCLRLLRLLLTNLPCL
jgi:hypothetical protein